MEIREVHRDIIVESLSYMRDDLAGLIACIAEDPELDRCGLMDALLGKQVLIARALHALHCNEVRQGAGYGIL